MTFLERFDQEWAAQLSSWGSGWNRAPTFRAVFVYMIDQHRSLNIVETGCMRPNGTFGGDGRSTLMFDAFVQEYGGNFTSIEIDPLACEEARTLTRHADIHCGDSVKELQEILHPVDVLYLDSVDDTKGTCEHQLLEFTTANRLLHPGSVVMSDDTWFTPAPEGKGKLLVPYMEKIGAKELTRGERQIAWIMP